jgi:SAM-dependent methyltransferase
VSRTVSSDLTDYYRGSSEYRAMLAEQDETLFAPYLSYFGRWAEPGARVLDVGCGVGTSTRLLREAGFDAVGTDTSARFLPDERGFFVADFARRTELLDGAFAAAGALNVIEHVADPRAFLDELVRVVQPGGLVVICSPNLTSPLVGARILVDLARRRTPYLGVRKTGAALALLARNVARSTAAALGRDAFAARADTLASGVIGYDADAIYWSNAAEVRRRLERLGCEPLAYQGEGHTLAARLVARLLPSFAGQLAVVVRVGSSAPKRM